MVTQVQPIFRYDLDQTDVIVSVNDWWLAFAKENNAAGLNEASVVGQSIWKFISDEPTRALYREIHDHVRSSGKSIKIPFRCDSPTLQRYMQLTISKGVDEQLLCESTLTRVSQQQRISVLDPKQKRCHARLTMCSFCKRSLIDPEGWLEMENISLNLRLFDRNTVPSLDYTVCPDCDIQLRQQTNQSSE